MAEFAFCKIEPVSRKTRANATRVAPIRPAQLRLLPRQTGEPANMSAHAPNEYPYVPREGPVKALGLHNHVAVRP